MERCRALNRLALPKMRTSGRLPSRWLPVAWLLLPAVLLAVVRVADSAAAVPAVAVPAESVAWQALLDWRLAPRPCPMTTMASTFPARRVPPSRLRSVRLQVDPRSRRRCDRLLGRCRGSARRASKFDTHQTASPRLAVFCCARRALHLLARCEKMRSRC